MPSSATPAVRGIICAARFGGGTGSFKLLDKKAEDSTKRRTK